MNEIPTEMNGKPVDLTYYTGTRSWYVYTPSYDIMRVSAENLDGARKIAKSPDDTKRKGE